MKAGDTKNLMRVSFWINTRCDYEDDFMKKIKNWLFNPQADEEDEWPIEPRFNSLLHSTMISDNHDNETRPQCTKTKAVFKEEEQITKGGFKSEDTGKILRLQHKYSKSLS